MKETLDMGGLTLARPRFVKLEGDIKAHRSIAVVYAYAAIGSLAAVLYLLHSHTDLGDMLAGVAVFGSLIFVVFSWFFNLISQDQRDRLHKLELNNDPPYYRKKP